MAKKPIVKAKPSGKGKTPAPIKNKIVRRPPVEEDEDEDGDSEEEEEEEEPEEDEPEEDEDAEEEEEEDEDDEPVAKKKKGAPAPVTKKKGGSAAPVAADADYWKNVFQGLDTAGNSKFIFPKTGKLKVRLLQGNGQPFFTEVNSTYMKKTKKKYLLLAWSPERQDESNNPLYEVQALILPKTAWKAIAGFLAEGYDFFSRKGGYGVTIIRSGVGRDTSYTVMPSKNPILLPPQLLESLAETTLDGMVEEFNSMMESRSGDDADSGKSEEWS